MSASREKKIRQELAAQGIPDIKEIRAAEERKQQRRANILYGSIAAAFVLVAAALLVWNSNVIQRNSTAMSVDGVKYSAAEVDYFYNSAVNSVLNDEYAGYMSINANSPMDQQVMTDMDLMFMGITLPEGKEEMTWHDYFVDYTKQQLVSQTAVLKAAEAEGFKFSDEMQADLDETMTTLADTAKASGLSLSAYLKTMFGASMTEPIFTKIFKDALTVSYFQEAHWNELTYTTDDMTKYYTENPDLFDVANYEYVYFKGTAPSTTDAEGNSIAPTEEESKAAKAKAEAAAADVLARFKAGESLEKLAEEYEDIATYYDQEEVSYTGGVVQEWVFDADRKAGDADSLDSGAACYVVTFHSRARNDYFPVNVRHILCKVDDSTLDVEADDYESKRQVLIDLAKAEAEALLEEYNKGAKTAESFAELASKNSDDTGSVNNGGLYSNVPKGQMVPEFNDWIFDESRQVGDTGIIFVEAANYTGYHVMYFDGVSETPYWRMQVEDTMRSNDYNEWYTSLSEGLTAEEHSGMKYVG